MKTSLEMKQELVEVLFENLSPPPQHPKKSDYVVRCPYCGDSNTPGHCHFHVKIDEDTELPIIFHCFRCDISGIFTSNTLRDLSIGDRRCNVDLTNYNNKAMKRIYNKLGIKEGGFNFKCLPPINEELAYSKKKYLEKRLGVSRSYEEWARLKVCFNLIEFLYQNEIKEMSIKDPKKIMDLKLHHIGFLSTMNEFVVCRNLGKGDRYYKYRIYKEIENINKTYVIPTDDVSIMSRDDIIVNIAEGTFDILGLYFNIFNERRNNALYAAVCGCGFMTVVEFFLKKGLIGENITFNIFSDRDKKPRFYDDIFIMLKPLVGHINLIYNELGKDYGVPANEIKLSTRRIK